MAKNKYLCMINPHDLNSEGTTLFYCLYLLLDELTFHFPEKAFMMRSQDNMMR